MRPNNAPKGRPLEKPARLTDDDATVWHLVLLRRPALKLFTDSKLSDERDFSLLHWCRLHRGCSYSLMYAQQIAVRGLPMRRAPVVPLRPRP